MIKYQCDKSAEQCRPSPNHTTTTTTMTTTVVQPPPAMLPPKKRDVWKEHICSMPCIDCNQLLIACTDFSSEGACILHKSRCSYSTNITKRQEYTLCEPGCLNCLAMRYGRYYHADPGLCITCNEYCLENSIYIAKDMGVGISSTEQEFIEELLIDYQKSLSTFASRQRSKHADANRFNDRSCAELDKSCKAGKSFMSYLDCLEWFVRCKY